MLDRRMFNSKWTRHCPWWKNESQPRNRHAHPVGLSVPPVRAESETIVPNLNDKLSVADMSPLIGCRESYRFWKRTLRDAGKQRCWSTIATRLKKKISQWRPASWNSQIPVDVNAIKNAKRQLLQWLSLPKPNCTETLVVFEIQDKQPGMFPMHRTLEVILVGGLYNGMNSKSKFEKWLMLFIDYLSVSGRRTLIDELTGPNSDT